MLACLCSRFQSESSACDEEIGRGREGRRGGEKRREGRRERKEKGKGEERRKKGGGREEGEGRRERKEKRRRREEGRWRSCVEVEDVKPSHNKTITTKNKHTFKLYKQIIFI